MTSTNIDFKPLEQVDDIAQIIEEVFNVKLNISGGWGYDNTTAVNVGKIDSSIDQFIDIYSNVRANIEMNLTLEDEDRYGGINLSFKETKEFEINNKIYDVVSFKITAMKEKVYAKFIKEYKDNYGKKEFDLSDHFNRRKESTVTRDVDYWFFGLRDN